MASSPQSVHVVRPGAAWPDGVQRNRARPDVPAPADARGVGIAASGDLGSRVGLMTALGKTAGNAATSRLLRSATIQREPPQPAPSGSSEAPVASGATSIGGGAAAADAAAKYMLTNARFTKESRLQDIAAGGPPLSKSDRKTVVEPVQTALLDVGYSLLRYKNDGKFGSETTTAIDQFRTDSKLPEGGGLDAPAIKVLDKRAPAPGKLEQHYLDYGRLFADNRLDVTLAIGYDEGQTHDADVASARAWFTDHKMTLTSGGGPATGVGGAVGGAVGDEAGGKDATKPKAATISVPETWTGKRTVTYPDADGKRVTKEITLSITLVPPGTGAKAAFAKGLTESELTLYSGHARRGTGPDFDADKSPYENFIIGINSALHKAGRVVPASAVAQHHYVLGKKNDLEQMKTEDAWKTDQYRVWFFAACISIAYMDELRGGLLPDKLDRHSLDLFGTRKEIPIAAGLAPVFSNLEGILAAETMEQIVDRMEHSTLEAFQKKIDESNLSDRQKAADKKLYKGDAFIREGAGDNPVAASP